VTINGQDAGTTHSVDCNQAEQYFTITTGDRAVRGASTLTANGVTAVVESTDSGSKMAAKSVQIRNVGGFTGSYWQGQVGNAEAKLAGTTFTITGTADGFNATDPSDRTTATFQIKAGC